MPAKGDASRAYEGGDERRRARGDGSAWSTNG